MALDTDWYIGGPCFGHCNCAWGCPCQFNSLPTTGNCEASWAMRIEKGHFGGTPLDGLVWGGLAWWPGAVHEGNGKQQLFYEERATPEQRKALEAIGCGDVSAEGTWFNIVAAMAPDFQPVVAATIDFDCDVEARTARVKVPDLIEIQVEPIRNPITNEVHRARVSLPGGMEFHEAEYGSGSSRTYGKAAIKLELSDSHAHLHHASWDSNGVVEVEA